MQGGQPRANGVGLRASLRRPLRLTQNEPAEVLNPNQDSISKMARLVRDASVGQTDLSQRNF